MRSRRVSIGALLVAGAVCSVPAVAQAQCCLSGLFSGTGCGCFKKAAPAYAVAPVPAPPPVAAVAAPVAAAPPQPVMVPVQQVSYVPETTYQTQYKCVPVTCYRPSCEIDPCTGCAVECVELVTNYVQQPVSVPVTQYRAVYTTKYVQMQPGGNPQAYTGAAVMPPNAAGAAASPFAAPQTTPQAWGAAGTAASPSVPTQQPVLPPATGGSTYQQQIVPQSGTYAAPQAPVQPQLTSPPTLAPTPSLRPIPELSQQPASEQPQQLSGANGADSPATTDLRDPGTKGTSTAPQQRGPAVTPPPSLRPIPPATSGPTSSSRSSYGTPLRGDSGMPVLPGNGPSSSTRAFPKLLEPTGHTTSWRPTRVSHPAGQAAVNGLSGQQATHHPPIWQPAFTQAPAGPYAQGWQPSYPTAALPTRSQQ
jgi:hypothetical protein